jgi:cellulose synthase/poly-beta-1,6-N-acetylglucosamine synthase-like glycosyltransferase
VKDLDDRFLSGDDVFLLQAMKRLPGKKTGYVLNRDAIVRSKPSKSLSGFLRQRQRWASKAKGYRDPLMVFTTVLVFAANLGILALLVCALAGVVPYLFFGILFGIRILADLPLLLAGMRFFRSSGLILWVIPVQILYPLYIAVAGVLSLVAPVRWEKR